jgi:hypothetical protein
MVAVLAVRGEVVVPVAGGPAEVVAVAVGVGGAGLRVVVEQAAEEDSPLVPGGRLVVGAEVGAPPGRPGQDHVELAGVGAAAGLGEALEADPGEVGGVDQVGAVEAGVNLHGGLVSLGGDTNYANSTWHRQPLNG